MILTRTTLREQAYREIKHLLITRELAPGAPISEPALVARLGVSRTPIREALLALASEGFLDGSYLNGPTNPSMRVHAITDAEREEVILVRRSLEKIAIKQLGPVVTDDHISFLRKNLEQQTELINSEEPLAFLEADADFHLSIAQFAGLAIVPRLLKNLRELFYLVGLPAVTGPEQREVVVREHKHILSAIANADVYEALSALDDHLDKTLARTQSDDSSRAGGGNGNSPE